MKSSPRAAPGPTTSPAPIPASPRFKPALMSFMDMFHGNLVPGFSRALTVLGTVVVQHGSTIVLDSGRKSISIDFVLPIMVPYPFYQARFFAEEHALFDVDERCPLELGDTVELVPGYAPSTVNLYDAFHVVEGGVVTEIWPVIPRGPGHVGILAGAILMKTSLPKPVSAQEFEQLFRKLCNWGRWGEDDERGTLNYITPDHVKAAARLVRTGRSVSLSLPINTVAGPDNPRPALHYMIHRHESDLPEGAPRFATDFLASEFHGDSFTHIDALCHVSYQGKLYNGKPVASVTGRGAKLQDITAFAHGIVGRGVLLDIPRLRGVPWLEPGEAVTPEELEAAEKAQGVTLGEGDILLFRTGHHRRRLERVPGTTDMTAKEKRAFMSRPCSAP